MLRAHRLFKNALARRRGQLGRLAQQRLPPTPSAQILVERLRGVGTKNQGGEGASEAVDYEGMGRKGGCEIVLAYILVRGVGIWVWEEPRKAIQ